MSKITKGWLLLLLPLCLMAWFAIRPSVKAYRTERYMLKYTDTIDGICKDFALSPDLYFSIVYAERIHNVNKLDKADFSRARLGFDASVGFAQLKMSTVAWIESNYPRLLPFSPADNRMHLIYRLSSPDTNIVYSVAYCRIIVETFQERFGYPPDVAAMASYYGRGIDYGKEMVNEFYLNELGLTAYDYYTRRFKEGR